jgi:signal transduction histidine kinase/DNA-binding response OmpR family regulator
VSPAGADPATPSGPQRLSPWFGITGLLLLATLLAAAFVQARQYALINTTVQSQDDYLALSLVQVELEYLRLREQLRKDVDTPGSPALQLRYDIFISRVAMLGTDRARRLMGNPDAGSGVLQDLAGFTRRADLYLGSEPGGALSPQAARTLLVDLETLDAPIHQLMLDASHQVAAQVTERQARVRNHNQIGLALTGFLLAMVALFAAVALRQMRALEQRRSRQALLADQLRDARIEAEAASAAKSEFMADMSHELRTPLHGLLGMLALARESPRDRRAADWLQTADDSAQQLQRLLDDILDLSKLGSGVLTLSPAPVGLAGLLREVRRQLQPAASAKGLDLQITLDPALPAQAGLDAHRVRQVLLNLVATAIKFADAGTITLQCRLPTEPTPGADGPLRLEFNVADSGIGMDRELLARLFHRQGRADDGRAARLSGTGLGLAIARNLARLMDGEIVVRSMSTSGTVFSFRCPALAAPARAAAFAAPTASAAQGLPIDRPLHVLVAEDHPVNRLYLAALLDRLGHRAKVVDNGLEALGAIEAVGAMQPAPAGSAGPATRPAEPPFDLVLMDVHMPVMDGVAATQAIRALPPPAGQICVVAITADVFADTQQRCLAAGVAEVVTKPLSLGGLQALLARHCANASAGLADRSPAVTDRVHVLANDQASSQTSGQAAEAPAVLLDHATLRSVRDLMGKSQAPTLYAGFFAQADDAARRMREAMRDADPEALRRSAHMVKGAALNLGLPALAQAATLLSQEASTLAAARLALAVQRFEEITTATRDLCSGEGLLH